MSEKQPIEQQIVAFLKEKGEATVEDVVAGIKISRTSARKYLAGLTHEGTVNREPGGREGRRKLPDRFSVPAKKPARKGRSAKAARGGSKNGRLGPGELDKHVLAYMRKHKDEAPHSPSAISKGIERSSGAVANCLARLEKRSEVRLARKKPRAYALKAAK